ncbi:MAG: hypothetical protein AAF569_07670 [Pseudomonadota bacterium]
MMQRVVKGRVNGRHPFTASAVTTVRPLQEPKDIPGMAASDAERICMPYADDDAPVARPQVDRTIRQAPR